MYSKLKLFIWKFSKPNNTSFSSLLSDLEKTLETKKQELAKKDQKLKEKDKEVATLQKENADTKAELKEEKKKINGEWGAIIFQYSEPYKLNLAWDQISFACSCER